MKFDRLVGGLDLTAACALALLGVGTASGTALCEGTPKAGTDCTQPLAMGTSIDFSIESGTSMLWKGPFGETIYTCAESTISGLVSNSGNTAGAVSQTVTTWTFASCNRPITVSAPGELAYQHKVGTDNGTVTSSGLTLTIHNVPLFGSCNYQTNATDIGLVTGNIAAAPTIDLGASIKSTNGCPTATWSGAFVYTGSTNFNVAAG